MNAVERMKEHQRLILLRQLQRLPGYSANDSYLQGTLSAFGLPGSRDQTRAHLQWLADVGAVTLTFPEGPENVMVATVTQMGLDVAAGSIRREGIQPPGPGSIAAAALGAAAASARDILGH